MAKTPPEEPFIPFAQFPLAVLTCPHLSHSAKIVYGVCVFRGNCKRYHWRSISTLADECGLDRSTVMRAMKELRMLALIDREPQHAYQSYITHILPWSPAIEVAVKTVASSLSQALRPVRHASLTEEVIDTVVRACWPEEHVDQVLALLYGYDHAVAPGPKTGGPQPQSGGPQPQTGGPGPSLKIKRPIKRPPPPSVVKEEKTVHTAAVAGGGPALTPSPRAAAPHPTASRPAPKTKPKVSASGMKAVENAARQRRVADENKRHHGKRLAPKKLGAARDKDTDALSHLLGLEPEKVHVVADVLDGSIHRWKAVDYVRQFDRLMSKYRKAGWIPIERHPVKVQMQWKNSVEGFYAMTGSLDGRWDQKDCPLTTYALLRFAAEHWKYLSGPDAYGNRLPEMFSIPYIYGSYSNYLTYADNVCQWVHQKRLDDWVAECVASCDDPTSKYRR